MFVYQKNLVGNKLFSHVKTFFYSKQFAKLLTMRLKTIYRVSTAVEFMFLGINNVLGPSHRSLFLTLT